MLRLQKADAIVPHCDTTFMKIQGWHDGIISRVAHVTLPCRTRIKRQRNLCSVMHVITLSWGLARHLRSNAASPRHYNRGARPSSAAAYAAEVCDGEGGGGMSIKLELRLTAGRAVWGNCRSRRSIALDMSDSSSASWASTNWKLIHRTCTFRQV